MNSVAHVQWMDILIRLVVAAVLGGIIGLERERSEKMAGLRTHILVALGSGLFTILSIEFAALDGREVSGRVASQIVTGIGFLGAGAILKQGFTVQGLTTAATLWVTAAIGLGAGFGHYVSAGIATGLALATLVLLGHWRVYAALHQRFANGSLQVTYQVGAHQKIVALLAQRQCELRTVNAALVEGKPGLESVHILMRFPRTIPVDLMLTELRKIPGIKTASLEVEGVLPPSAE